MVVDKELIVEFQNPRPFLSQASEGTQRTSHIMSISGMQLLFHHRLQVAYESPQVDFDVV